MEDITAVAWERPFLVINGQTAPRNGYSKADAGISNAFDISITLGKFPAPWGGILGG
jgi:hypothetical protein